MATEDEQWKAQIAAETDSRKKSILMQRYEMFLQTQKRDPPSVRFDPLKVVYSSNLNAITLEVWCSGFSTKTVTARTGSSFKKTILHCNRAGLPFVNLKPTPKFIVDDELSYISFVLDHYNDWSGGTDTTIPVIGNFDVEYSGDKEVAPGWYTLVGFIVTQNTGSNGVVYTNKICQEFRPWEEGPSYMALHSKICELWTGSRFKPRPLDPKFHPPHDLVNTCLAAIQSKNPQPAGAQSTAGEASSSSAVGADGDKKKDKKGPSESDLAFAEAFKLHVQSMDINWQRHPDLIFQHPKARSPYPMPLTIGAVHMKNQAMDMRGKTKYSPIAFNPDIRVKTGGDVKPYPITPTNLFSTHLTASAVLSIDASFYDTGEHYTMSLSLSSRMPSFFHFIGIVNPNIAQGVLPRVMNNIPMSVAASPNARNTVDLFKRHNIDDPSSDLAIDIFQSPYVDHLTFIRENAVEVPVAFAIQEIQRYTMTMSPAIKPAAGKAKVSQLYELVSSVKYTIDNNQLPMLTNGQIVNCFECKLSFDMSSGDKYRFYAMTGNKHAPSLDSYFDAVRQNHLVTPNPDAEAVVQEFVAAFPDDFKKTIFESQFFLPNEDLITNGVTPTTAIFAISRDLDRTEYVRYENSAFSLENVIKCAEEVAQLNAESRTKLPEPVAVVVEQAPALDDSALSVHHDFEADTHAASSVSEVQTEPVSAFDDSEFDAEVPVVRTNRKRTTPTSPGKKGAVKKAPRN